MKGIIVRELGDPNQALKVENDIPAPELKPGHVLIKNHYSGINFIDTYYRTGLYSHPNGTPFISGQEGGGEVVAVSDDAATDVKIGDRVVYGAFGSCAEYTAVPASNVIPVPDGVDLDVATACMVQGMTAHYLVTSAHADLIQPGEWCLIYSVGSGTCQWAAQMAKLKGYKVIGTCSRSKESVAKSLLCDELIVLESATGASYADYNSVDIPSKIMQITNGEGVKCIIDGVGKSTLDISMKCLARRGILISFGNASGVAPPLELLRLLPKSAFVTRPKLNDYTVSRQELLERATDVFSWVKNGDIKIGIDAVFSLDQAADAHRYIESGKTKGKLLYKIQ